MLLLQYLHYHWDYFRNNKYILQVKILKLFVILQSLYFLILRDNIIYLHQ